MASPLNLGSFPRHSKARRHLQAGDRLPAASLVGAMLIIVGVLLSGFDRKRSPEETATAAATDEPARL